MPHIVLRQQAFVDHIFWHHLLPFLINVAIEWVFLSCRWFLKAYSHQVGTKYHISRVASHNSFLSVHELPYMALYNLTFHLAYVLFIELRILLFRSFTEGCHDAFRVQLSLLDAPHKSHNHSCGIDAARPEQIDLSPIEFIEQEVRSVQHTLFKGLPEIFVSVRYRVHIDKLKVSTNCARGMRNKEGVCPVHNRAFE